MAVSKFTQPDNTAKATDQAGFEAYCGEIQAALDALGQRLAEFQPYANATPDMTIFVDAGNLSHHLGITPNRGTAAVSECSIITTAAQQTPAFSAPSSGQRIDRIGVNLISGALEVIAGVAADSPVPLGYYEWLMPICQVAISAGQTCITNAHITDERGMTVSDGPSSATIGSTAAFNQSRNYQFFAPGSHTFTPPPQAKFLKITAGGGGGTGGQTYFNGTTYYGGGGGGGGAIWTVTVAPEVLALEVGRGGSVALTGGPGEASTVSGSFGMLTANGGGLGANGTTSAVGAGGTGGAATNGGFSGGNGSNGTSGTAAPTGAPGSAGYCGNGGVAGDGGSLSAGFNANNYSLGILPRLGFCGGGSVYINSGGTGSEQPGGSGFVLIEWE